MLLEEEPVDEDPAQIAAGVRPSPIEAFVQGRNHRFGIRRSGLRPDEALLKRAQPILTEQMEAQRFTVAEPNPGGVITYPGGRLKHAPERRSAEVRFSAG